MKQKHIFLVCLLWLSFNSCTQDFIEEPITNQEPVQTEYSDRVTPSEAIQIADSYIKTLFPETRNTSMRSTPTIDVYGAKALTRSSDMAGLDTILYILNYPEQGFALVGADRRMQNQIYAISENGSLNLRDTIDFPELKTLMGTIENKIVEELETTTRAGYVVSPSDNRVWQVQERIEKTVATKWGQSAPFNQYCNTETGALALAGCGPIAVSQIMYYHKHPSQHTNTRTGAFYEYNWEQMKYVTDAAATYRYPEYTQNVARLIEQVGSECRATYGVRATSTYLYKCVTGMENMGYEIMPVNGSQITYYNIDYIKDGLNTTGPVLATGQSNDGGHAWVIDGYLKMIDITSNVASAGTKELVRCNWGWNSRADGYYMSGIFDTRQGAYVEGNGTNGSYDFYYSFQIVPKITPAMTGSAPSLPEEIRVNEDEWCYLDVNWDIPNKDDYIFEWHVEPRFEYHISANGRIRFKCKLPDWYSVSVRIKGKYNSYDSGWLNCAVMIKEDMSITAQNGRVEVMVGNYGSDDAFFYLSIGLASENILVPKGKDVIFGMYVSRNQTHQIYADFQLCQSGRFYGKEYTVPRLSMDGRDMLIVDLGRYGLEQFQFNSYEFEDCSYYWERGMPE